jgi:hypothetical protein
MDFLQYFGEDFSLGNDGISVRNGGFRFSSTTYLRQVLILHQSLVALLPCAFPIFIATNPFPLRSAIVTICRTCSKLSIQILHRMGRMKSTKDGMSEVQKSLALFLTDSCCAGSRVKISKQGDGIHKHFSHLKMIVN